MKKLTLFGNILFLLLFAVQGWANPPHFNMPAKQLPNKQFNPPKTPHSQPDLAVKSITASDSLLQVGKEFTIVVTVKNTTSPRNPFTGKPQQAKSLPTKLSLQIGRTTHAIFSLSPLNAGQSVNLSQKYKPRHPGDLTVTAVVDPNNQLREHNRRNNTRSRTFDVSQPPDLRIISFKAVPGKTLLLPGSIDLVATVKNFGGPSQATTMLFTLHGDIDNDMDVVERPKKSVRALTHNETIRIPWRFTPVKPGLYIIGGQVDPDNKVAESNESNNVVPQIHQIQVKEGGADLDLISLSANHNHRHWYQKFVVTAQVTNRGNMASGPFKIHLYRLFDKPAGWAQGSRKDTPKSCPSLTKGQTCTVKFEFEYKKYVGNPHVSVRVDPEKKVKDFNRRNNQRKLHLRVL